MTKSLTRTLSGSLDCFCFFRSEKEEPRNNGLHVPSLRACEAIQIQVTQSGLLPASYLAVRNDGNLFRHHSFLQKIYHMPGSTNDKQSSPFEGGRGMFLLFCHSERSEESGTVGKVVGWLFKIVKTVISLHRNIKKK